MQQSLRRRSRGPRGLRRRSAAACRLRWWVRIPAESWMFVCCACCVLWGTGLCDELFTCLEKSYRLCCVVVCDLETSSIRPCPNGGSYAKLKKISTAFITSPSVQPLRYLQYINCVSFSVFIILPSIYSLHYIQFIYNSIFSIFIILPLIYVLHFPREKKPLVGKGLLIIEASRSHSVTAHSLGLLWTSDRPISEISA